MGGDEVGNQVLFLASLLAELVKHCFETIVGTDARFHHFVERTVFSVFRRNL